MPLKFVGETCGIEVYGPDEDGVRIICTKVSGCPLNHPGEIGLDCLLNKENHPELIGLGYFGAGSAGRTDAVAGPVATTTQEVRPEGGDPPVETSGHAPGTPEVEPGAGKAGGSERRLSAEVRADCGPPAPDSHMVVDKDREEMVQKYVDKLNEISMEMYLESRSSGPPPIPMLGPRETEEFLKNLNEFKLTPEQQEFYRDARRRFPPEQPRRKLLKHRRRYAVRESGGMIRMPGNKPEPPEPEEESFFEVDDEVHGPVVPRVKAEPELQKPVPKVERPDETEEEEELEDEDEVTLIDDMETMSMRAGDPEAMGYVVDLLIQTDEDNDHSAILTIDNITIEIMLGDFIEIVEALERMLPRMRDIQSS